MKRIVSALAFVLAFVASPATADVYVIVDSNNVVVSGAIVCDANVCGDPNSLYSRLTLKAGERYVLQGRTDANGNNSGIGAQPNQILVVKEELTKNTFVAIAPSQTTVIVTPTVPEPTPTPIATPIPAPVPTPTSSIVLTESSTVTTDTAVVTVAETSTAVAVVETTTVTTTDTQESNTPIFDSVLFDWLLRWEDLWADLLAWLSS